MGGSAPPLVRRPGLSGAPGSQQRPRGALVAPLLQPLGSLAEPLGGGCWLALQAPAGNSELEPLRASPCLDKWARVKKYTCGPMRRQQCSSREVVFRDLRQVGGYKERGEWGTTGPTQKSAPTATGNSPPAHRSAGVGNAARTLIMFRHAKYTGVIRGTWSINIFCTRIKRGRRLCNSHRGACSEVIRETKKVMDQPTVTRSARWASCGTGADAAHCPPAGAPPLHRLPTTDIMCGGVPMQCEVGLKYVHMCSRIFPR